MSPESLVKRDDGSISYTVKCPFSPCSRQYIVTYQRYPSHYVHTKGTKKHQKSSNVKRPKWNYLQIKKHFKKEHSHTRQRSVKTFGYFDSTKRTLSKILFIRKASLPKRMTTLIFLMTYHRSILLRVLL